ncbi:MAG: Fe3+/spermidine/putrescine transporter ATP-binding protein [Verrucomicrobiales bacterium]|nr:Fe3+/spermidine/putrescine transporter ATP-binding protein [Verrucomicrobiales bacterium]
MTQAVPHFSKLVSTQSGSAIETVDLVRHFGPVTALDRITLTIRDGEFFSLLGPSGCGKTTLLRIIAGLDVADSGTLHICGTNADEIPAHKRPVNTVFQNYALFPHLTVLDNVSFGLRMKKVGAAEIKARVENAMNVVEVADLAQRKPHQISGGQKQRVALARAIVNEPKVLLLDEPLGALDLKLRKQLQVQLHQLQRRLGITFIYVTHDQEEALVMSDRIAVMNAGRIEQLDRAENIYESPRTRFVAEFLGSCNVISGVLKQKSTDSGMVETPLGQFVLHKAIGKDVGANLSLAVRPEKISLEKLPSGDKHTRRDNDCPARIEEKIYSGAETQFRLRIGEQTLMATQLNSKGNSDFSMGEAVLAHIPESAFIVLED